MSNQVGKAGLLILAQNLFFGLVWGSNYEMDMLRLKFTLRGKWRLTAIWAPSPPPSPNPPHGNEADQKQLFNAWASFAFSFLYLFLL